MKVFLIGPIDKGNVPTNGVTMKNQLFEMRFKELFEEVITIDTWGITKRPWIVIKMILSFLFNKKAKFVLSGGHTIRWIALFLFYSNLKRDVYFWVAGGSIINAIKSGLYNKKALQRFNAIIVQGKSMAEELNNMGFTNAIYVPNSKPVVFRPKAKAFNSDRPFRFVFLSRIHPDKGCDDIIKSVIELNSEDEIVDFEVDFYGPLFDSYKESFMSQIAEIKNVDYKGFLNLTEISGYETLSQYDAMLFPTFWEGEGFPGIILDAYIAGLPVIASDWNLNCEVIENNRSGIIIPVHDVSALTEAMRRLMQDKERREIMRDYCLLQADRYDTRSVLSKELMTQLGFYAEVE